MEENHEDWDHHCHIFVSLSTSLVMSSAAHAATSPAMQACSKQWADMKAAGQSAGQTWPHFWSQCSKEAAAKNGSDLLMSRSAKTDEDHRNRSGLLGTRTPAPPRPHRKKTAMPSGIRARRNPVLTVGTTTFSSCLTVCDHCQRLCTIALSV